MAQAIKVGIFATIGLVLLAFLIWNIEDINPFGPKGKRLDAVFQSVAGLDDKAAVRVAGVRVGKVDGIGLEGQQAKVSLLLDKPLPLTVGTTARIANMGLLGDKYVELVPGPADAPPLPEGTVLAGTTPVSFDDALAKLNSIGDSIQQVAGGFGGQDFGRGVNELVRDIQLTSREIRMLVVENRATVASAVANFDRVGATLAQELPKLASQMQRALDQINAVVGENRENLAGGLENFREASGKIQVSIDNLNKITDKIASGEGTIGKLVNDDKAYNEVVKTLDSIQGGVATLSETLGAVRKLNLDLDLQGTYLLDPTEETVAGLNPQTSQTFFGVVIDPQDGKHLYKGGIGNTRDGKRKTKTQTIVTTNPDGTTSTETIRTFTAEDRYAVSALLGYQGPRDARLWGGLIEGKGGVQIEYPMLDRRLWLSLEAFDFNRELDLSPHLRVSGRWQFHPNVYLTGGYDDALENDSLFLGAGIRWRDDNLKYLLGSLPIN